MLTRPEGDKHFASLGMFLLLLGFFTCCGDLCAQEPAEPRTQESAEAETSAQKSQDDEESDSERATDMREAINENLDTMRDTAEPAETSDRGTKPSDDSPDESVPSEPDEEHWYNRFESATEFMQTAPDNIPFLGGREWVHFGRVEGEYGYFSEGILKPDSGFNLRSLRGGLIKKFNERTTVKLEIDLTDGDSNFVDMYGRFKTRFGLITLGNQKVAQTLVGQTSRLSRTFMEVPLPADAFGLGRRLGVGWDFHLNKVGAHLTAFGRDLNEDIGKFGYGARFYVNPTKTRFSMFHLGVSAVREQMDRDARFRAYPETHVTDTRLVDTLRHSEVNNQSILGLEIAGARDSYSVRAEYFIAEWERTMEEDPRFEGYYLQANWAITGEAFQYAQGKFLRLRPNGHRGAWEVAVRYSQVDLSDLDVAGGKERNASLALNWYGPGNQLRVMSTLIYVQTDEVAGDQSPLIAQVRVQVNW